MADGSENDDIAITPDGKTAYVANTTARHRRNPDRHRTRTPPEQRSASAEMTAAIVITPTARPPTSPSDSQEDNRNDTAANSHGVVDSSGADRKGSRSLPTARPHTSRYKIDNNVTPIDIATNTAGTTIPVGNSPDTIAITPDGKTVYVVNQNSNDVTPIDTATNTAGTAIPFGNPGDFVAGIAIRRQDRLRHRLRRRQRHPDRHRHEHGRVHDRRRGRTDRDRDRPHRRQNRLRRQLQR